MIDLRKTGRDRASSQSSTIQKSAVFTESDRKGLYIVTGGIITHFPDFGKDENSSMTMNISWARKEIRILLATSKNIRKARSRLAFKVSSLKELLPSSKLTPKCLGMGKLECGRTSRENQSLYTFKLLLQANRNGILQHKLVQ